MGGNEQKERDWNKVDVNNLYREETFTDLKVASIRRLTPLKPDGSPDGSRKTIFLGQTHVVTPVGALPVQCTLDAETIEEAARKFPEAIAKAVEKMIAEVKELQRKEESRIVVPGSEGQKKIIVS
jgi:hypothetical protein